MSKKLKIVGFSQLHNELENGNLKNWFKSMNFCDKIYIYDQGSTDDSINFYKTVNNVHTIESKVNRFSEELYCKQELLTKLLYEQPDTDWIFWMDGDTVLDARLTPELIEQILLQLESHSVDSVWLGHYNLWRSDVWHRVDDQYDSLMSYGCMAFWKNTGALHFYLESGLHKSQYPMGLNRGVRIPFNLIHRGFSDDNQIIKKYYNYKSRGQSGWALDRLVDESTLKVDRVPDEEVPSWCRINIENPLNKLPLIKIKESILV